jgi:hypothetical protein
MGKELAVASHFIASSPHRKKGAAKTATPDKPYV